MKRTKRMGAAVTTLVALTTMSLGLACRTVGSGPVAAEPPLPPVEVAPADSTELAPETEDPETPRPARDERPEGEEGAPLRVGVVLPLSGSPYLEQYGEFILEGIRLARTEAERRGSEPVELVVRDNKGDPGMTAGIISEFERQDISAVIGPLLDRALRAAERARDDPSLVIVSPTAMRVDDDALNVYSLNTGDIRGAREAADYLLDAGYERIGTIYPRTERYSRMAETFMLDILRGGGILVGAMPYDSGTTTFGTQLTPFRYSRPQAIYIPAPIADVQQIAPQVAYYGLDTLGIHVVGNEAWASQEIRRLVEPRFLVGVLASTPVPETSPLVGWSEFVDLYENTYRKSLSNRYPALGYDALRLLMAAAPSGFFSWGNELARRFSELDDVTGATGMFTVQRGRITRRPFMVVIQGGALVPAPNPALAVPPPIVLPGDTATANSPD